MTRMRSRLLDTTVTYLALDSRPAQLPPMPTSPRLALMRAENIPLHFYRYLYGAVGSGSDLDIAGNVTVSAWIYPTASTAGTTGTVIRVGIGADERFGLTYNYINQAIGFQWYDGVSFPGTNTSKELLVFSSV